LNRVPQGVLHQLQFYGVGRNYPPLLVLSDKKRFDLFFLTAACPFPIPRHLFLLLSRQRPSLARTGATPSPRRRSLLTVPFSPALAMSRRR
jgi:hypothetical protein